AWVFFFAKQHVASCSLLPLLRLGTRVVKTELSSHSGVRLTFCTKSRLPLHLASSTMLNVAIFVPAIPGARLGSHHLRLQSVRLMSVLLLAGVSIAPPAIIPAPAVTSPCSVPALLGGCSETIGAGDARFAT